MRVLRKNVSLVLFAAAIIMAGNATAGIVTEYLPINADYDYEGFVFYNQESENKVDGDYLRGRIEFAVYDTSGPNGWLDAFFEDFGSGRYIYAYQIFNNYEGISEETVGFFAVRDVNGNPIDESLINDTGFGDAVGMHPVIPPETKGEWVFNDTDAEGYIVAGEISTIIAFRSDYGPTKGSYEIREPETTQYDLLVPGDGSDIPEPATLALLGLGSVTIFLRRRKQAK